MRGRVVVVVRGSAEKTPSPTVRRGSTVADSREARRCRCSPVDPVAYRPLCTGGRQSGKRAAVRCSVRSVQQGWLHGFLANHCVSSCLGPLAVPRWISSPANLQSVGLASKVDGFVGWQGVKPALAPILFATFPDPGPPTTDMPTYGVHN